MEQKLAEEKKVDPSLYQRWEIVKTWSERARYEVWTQEAADAMLDAVGAADKGLLQWLRKR